MSEVVEVSGMSVATSVKSPQVCPVSPGDSVSCCSCHIAESLGYVNLPSVPSFLVNYQRMNFSPTGPPVWVEKLFLPPVQAGGRKLTWLAQLQHFLNAHICVE